MWVEAKNHNGLGFVVEAAAIIGATASLSSAISQGIGVATSYDLARKQLQHQKQIDSIQAAMDIQAHTIAMQQAQLALETMDQNMARAQRLASAQENATMAAIELQEEATKKSDFGTAQQAIGLQHAAVQSGAFDVYGAQQAQQRATAAGVGGQKFGPIVLILIGAGLLFMRR